MVLPWDTIRSTVETTKDALATPTTHHVLTSLAAGWVGTSFSFAFAFPTATYYRRGTYRTIKRTSVRINKYASRVASCLSWACMPRPQEAIRRIRKQRQIYSLTGAAVGFKPRLYGFTHANCRARLRSDEQGATAAFLWR